MCLCGSRNLVHQIALTAEQKARAIALLSELQRREPAKTSLLDYIAYCDLGFTPARHHRLLLDELAAVEATISTGNLNGANRERSAKLMVFMPPGSGKSSYTSAVFPAWFLGRHPTASVIACSHTQELAESFGRRVRNLFAGPKHGAVFGVGVAPDNQAAGRWETTKQGEYFAAGVGGSITGRRADLGLIDDPVKGREDADSERSRNRTWDWYLNDFLPRLKPGAAQILVMTRWHEDDLAGRLLEREGVEWRQVTLPMEAMPGDVLGRAPGERLWPEWFTQEMVDIAKRDVRGWNALYQQQPAAMEGDYFHLDWFGAYDELPEELALYGASDYAVTGNGGDYTEHGVFGIDALGNVYIVDWWRDQATSDVWIERQCDLIRRHEPLCWFGEGGPIRRAIEPYLLRRMTERRTFSRIEWLPSVADKPTRCRPFQALASMGKVLLPAVASWKAELLGQLTRFPAGRFDDGVDVCSLFGRGLEVVKPPRIRRAERRAPMPIRRPQEAGLDWMAS